MAGMDMGSARFPLRQVGDGRWQNDIMLPVCVTGPPGWLMLLTIGGEHLQGDSPPGQVEGLAGATQNPPGDVASHVMVNCRTTVCHCLRSRVLNSRLDRFAVVCHRS